MTQASDETVGALPVTEPPTHAPASLLANSAFMLIARGFTLATGGALAIYAIRSFSVGSYGRYAIAVALITIFTALSEMGISALALRTMSYDELRAEAALGTALAAEVLTSLGALLFLFPVALALGYPDQVLILLAIGSGIVLFQGVLGALEAAFKARRLMVNVAIYSVVQSGVTAALGFALVALGAGPVGLLIALVAGAVAAVPLGLYLLRRNLGMWPEWNGALQAVLPFLRASIPIALTGAVTVVYERIDLLMISKLDSASAAAVYAVPLTIVQYTLLIPAVVGTAFFPVLASTLKSDAAEARSSLFLLSRLFLLASAPIAIFLMAGGTDLVTTLFGERYEASGPVLTLLAWTIIFGFQIFLLWYALLATFRERRMVAIMAGGLILNVALNSFLIPAYGPKGAGAALIVSDLTILAGQAVLVQRDVFAIPWKELFAKPAVATIVTLPLVLLLTRSSGILAGAVGALVFAAILLATRYVSRTEWRPLTEPIEVQLGRLRRMFLPSRA
jgi:PST family polysaccharide transporter